YDQRIMSFKGLDRVSLLTLEGRILVPLVMGKYQSERFHHQKGQSDFVRGKDGKWFLLVTVDAPDKTPVPATDFIGVDFGVINIAADSDGKIHTGDEIEQVRQKNNQVRRSLQRKATRQKRQGKRPKNVRRKLKLCAGKERRFKRDTNHRIAKELVEKAQDTGRGIALEDLRGIRDRTRFRAGQRDKMAKWSFAELRTFIEYKAAIKGVEVVAIDPRNTSKGCSQCGHLSGSNRSKRFIFLCRECGYFDHADVNGAKNIASAAFFTRREGAEKALAA